jgi:hypothetical protein
MNERIQALAEQACLDLQLQSLSLRVEKFAELIVKECVVMTKGYEFGLGRKDELSKTMREHFGVEE